MSFPISDTRLRSPVASQLTERAPAPATILITDDDAAMRTILERYLAMFGYRTVSAAHGEEALTIARETPEIKLIILDVMMPGLSGQELAIRLTGLLPRALFLFCSGHPATTLVRLGVHVTGAHQFMQKPCRPADLKQRISDMLAHLELASNGEPASSVATN